MDSGQLRKLIYCQDNVGFTFQIDWTLCQIQSDFGYKTIRIFFETSHAKGEQDAAGGHAL